MLGRTASAACLAALLLAPPLAAEPAKLPAEVAAFVARLKGCQHWAGEEPYDAARGREIAAAVRTLRCDAIEADEARLRRRHRDDPAVLRALSAAG